MFCHIHFFFFVSLVRYGINMGRLIVTSLTHRFTMSFPRTLRFELVVDVQSGGNFGN